jgi:hypothetical protein
VIRAAGRIADDEHLIVIGSQSILGQYPHPPETLTVSAEADIYPRTHPERADDIDGTIGEASDFHELYGYYAQGVGPGTAVLPDRWEDRLVPLRTEATNGVTGWCLEVHDLTIAKLVAGREKDIDFVRELARHEMIDEKRLLGLVGDTPASTELRAVLGQRIRRAFSD